MDSTNLKGDGWLKPSDIIKGKLVPIKDRETLIRKFKSGLIQCVIDSGRYYTRQEWIEAYLTKISGGQNA